MVNGLGQGFKWNAKELQKLKGLAKIIGKKDIMSRGFRFH